jgi:hypothetical protein
MSQFTCARCCMCNAYLYTESRVLAFQYTPYQPHVERRLEPIDLAGREPWSGIRCVCVHCANAVEEGLARKDAKRPYPVPMEQT